MTWAHPEFGQVLATCSFDRTALIWEEQGSWFLGLKALFYIKNMTQYFHSCYVEWNQKFTLKFANIIMPKRFAYLLKHWLCECYRFFLLVCVFFIVGDSGPYASSRSHWVGHFYCFCITEATLESGVSKNLKFVFTRSVSVISSAVVIAY